MSQEYVQSSYNMQQQSNRLYAPPIAADYIPLSEYKTQRRTFAHYEESSSLFLRIQDVIGEKSEFIFPQAEENNPAKSSYEMRAVYLPQRREEKKEVDDIDKKELSELIDNELKQLNVQVQYV